MTHRILLLTGMTPDERIFDRLLPLLPTASIVPWIDPLPRETIRGYAKRLADSVPLGKGTIVCGVSFGGMIARELALHVDAQACVLISSVRDARQMPPWLRWLRSAAFPGLESILKAVGRAAAGYPRPIRTSATARLARLGGASGAWHRWATTSALWWTPSPGVDRIPLVQIHGERDTTFPIRFIHPTIVVAGGGHVLPLTHSAEIAAVLSKIAA